MSKQVNFTAYSDEQLAKFLNKPSSFNYKLPQVRAAKAAAQARFQTPMMKLCVALADQVLAIREWHEAREADATNTPELLKVAEAANMKCVASAQIYELIKAKRLQPEQFDVAVEGQINFILGLGKAA